jgi:hypothetical protein
MRSIGEWEDATVPWKQMVVAIGLVVLIGMMGSLGSLPTRRVRLWRRRAAGTGPGGTAATTDERKTGSSPSAPPLSANSSKHLA